MSQQITPPQPKHEQANSMKSRFNLSIAYRLLIGAYIRTTGDVKDDDQSAERTKPTKQS